MFRQMGIGAAAVLSIGLLAAGCSDDGDTIVQGGAGELANNDQSSLTTIASNNLAPDGGGLSQNDASVEEFNVTFNCDCCGSDGTFSGDNSAIVLFEVNDTGGSDRIYACHFDGSSLTPPVELFGDDRDDSQDPNLAAFVCIPLNTSGYQASSSTAGVAATQANDGNWLILGAASTLFTDPVLRGVGGSGNLTTTNARGKRFALYSWRFVKANRDVPTAVLTYNAISETFRYGFEETGDIVNTTFQGGGAVAGNTPSGTAAAGLAVPPNHVTSYGFVSDTLCGQACFGGNALPFSADGNVASNAYQHPDTGGANSVVTTAQSTAFTHAIPTLSRRPTGSAIHNNGMDPFGNGTDAAGNNNMPFLGYRTPSYTVGESTSFITAVWTQVCNSFSGGGTFTAGIGGSHAGGHELQIRSRGFDMANMVWEANEAEIVEPASRNANTTATRAGTAPFPTFYVSNNFLYFKYADASLITNFTGATNENLVALTPGTGAGYINWSQRETGGHEGGNCVRTGLADQGFWEEIIAVQRFVDDADGTSSPSGAVVDLSSDSNTRTGSASHTLTNVTLSTVNNGRDTYPADREMANFNGSGQFILGPDGGNQEYSLFYVMADNSNTTANPNIDSELCVVVHDANGAFVAGTNPNRISGTSVADFHVGVLGNQDGNAGGTGLTLLEDPIVPNNVQGTTGAAGGTGAQGTNAGAASAFTSGGNGPTYFSLCVNRTGTWAGILYKKDTGVSSGANNVGTFHQALFVNIYQPFRLTAGTTGTGTAANVDARTLASGPVEVNSTGLLPSTYVPANRADVNGIGQGLSDAESFRNWDNFPVNTYAWQGKLGYRCGMQSNANVASMFFEQSDATSDRVWGRQMTVTVGATGTPTMAFTGAAAELDASDAIVSHASFTINPNTAVSRNGATSFPFIDGDGTATSLRTCDSGVDVAGATGQVLVVYRKIVDNTNTDGDLADAQVRAVVWSGTAFGTSVAIDTRTNENAAVVASTGNNNETNPTNSSNGNVANNSTAAGNPHTALICTPNNQDITSLPSYPTVAGEVNITIFFTDREATLTTTGGTNTVSTNASRRVALYARKWTSTVTGTTALDVAGRILPTTTGDVQPVQADHEASAADDITTIRTFQNGGTIGALFETENQLWLNVTTDNGETFLSNNGLSNPALLSNASAEDVLGAPAFRFFPCTDANGDTTNGILLFAKNDRDGDARLHARAGNAATN